jgi:hypothetical protein
MRNQKLLQRIYRQEGQTEQAELVTKELRALLAEAFSDHPLLDQSED